MFFIFEILSFMISLLPWLSTLVIIILTAKLLFRNRKNANSWAVGIPEVKPAIYMGNMDWSTHLSVQYEKHYKALKGLKYGLWYEGGPLAFGEVRLFIMDPDIATKIQITDSEHFLDTNFLPEKYTKAMGSVFGLVDLKGQAWKKVRRAATPPFSLPKVKKFMPYFNKTCTDMVNNVHHDVESKSATDCKELIRKVVLNTLVSIGFGMEANAFDDKESEFKKQSDGLNVFWRWITLIMVPSIASLLKIKVYNPEAIKFFTSIVKRGMEQRTKDQAIGKDILGTLIQIHQNSPEDLSERDLINTVLQFMFDGYHTASENILAVLYYVAVHTEVQSKMVEEIDAAFDSKRRGDGLTESDVTGMSYVDCVILEANRHISIGFTTRVCTRPWKIPETDIILPVGSNVVIPVSSFHMDPDYWENPEEFIPERFDGENKGKIKTGTFQPFGLGPRQCLGNIYAKFKTKMILIYLLRYYAIDNFENRPKKMEFDNEAFFSPKDGLRLKFIKRSV